MADERISIGPGIAVYPRLKTPDTKFDENGIYKADLAVDLKQAEPLIEKLRATYKAHTGKALPKDGGSLYDVETDEAGEETGRVVFKIRVKNRITKKGDLWDRRPKQFGADLKPIDENPWGGTKMVVSAEIYLWTAGDKKGVSLQPVGVQILKLVTGSGEDAEDMGFKAQEGYTAPVDEDAADFTDTSEGADEGEDDEGVPEDGDY